MARPKKYPTKSTRIRVEDLLKIRVNAKRRKMSVPDYLAWRLNQ